MDKPCILRALSFQEGEIPCILGWFCAPFCKVTSQGWGCSSPVARLPPGVRGCCGAGAPSTFLSMQGGVSVLLLSPAGFLQLCCVPRAVAQGF